MSKNGIRSVNDVKVGDIIQGFFGSPAKIAKIFREHGRAMILFNDGTTLPGRDLCRFVKVSS